MNAPKQIYHFVINQTMAKGLFLLYMLTCAPHYVKVTKIISTKLNTTVPNLLANSSSATYGALLRKRAATDPKTRGRNME